MPVKGMGVQVPPRTLIFSQVVQVSTSLASPRGMTVRRPDWWFYPEQCENGHEWGPGRVLVSWERCHCAGGRSAHPEDHSWGHTTVECGEPGVPVEVVVTAARARDPFTSRSRPPVRAALPALTGFGGRRIMPGTGHTVVARGVGV